MREKNDGKIFVGAGLFLAISYTFLIGHIDGNTIMHWAYDLLDSFRMGRISEFPEYTTLQHGMSCNYTLFTNVINAIWLSPLYLIDRLFHLNLNGAYWIWYKLFVLSTAVLNAYLLDKVLRNENSSREYIYLAQGLYFTSAMVVYSVIGKGQVDGLTLTFLLFGVISIQNKKKYMPSIWFGLGVLVKPYFIIMAVPILLLYDCRSRWKSLRYYVVFFLPVLIDRIITDLLMPRYQEYVDLTSSEYAEFSGISRMDELFSLRSGEVAIFWLFVVILCCICIYMSVECIVQRRHYYYIGVLSYGFLAICVSTTSYWYIVIIPLVLVIAKDWKHKYYLGFIFAMINIGVLAYGILSERNMAPSLYYSIVPKGIEYSDLNLIIDMIGGYCSYVRFFAATLIVAGIVLVLVIDVMERKKEGEAETDCIIGQSVCYAFPGVVLLAYEVLVICYQLLG